MEISRLDHVALVCADTSVSKDWYIDIFGMEWIHQGMWDNNPLFLRKGDCYLALFQAGTERASPGKKGARIDHFAFRAETRRQYEAIKEELREKELSFKEQDHEISLSIYLKDPDGFTVEVTTYDL